MDKKLSQLFNLFIYSKLFNLIYLFFLSCEMQVRKFSIEDWELRGKKWQELKYVSGIQYYTHVEETKGEDGQTEKTVVIRVYTDTKEEEEDFEALVARLQGETIAYIENTCTPLWVGYIDRWRPAGIWFRGQKLN